MKLFAALILLLLQSAPQPVFRTNVNFVELDVSVLDKDRRPVLDLTAADFTVLEDGVPQKVETFSAVVLPEPEPPPTAWWTSVPADVERNSDVGEGAILVLVIDTDRFSLSYRVKQIARRLVERMSPVDQMAIVHTAVPGISQDFTSDRARLMQSVDSFGTGLRTGREPDAASEASAGGPSADAQGPDGSQVCPLVDALIDVAKSTAAYQGRRKAAFVIGEGFPAPDPKSVCFQPLLELYREAQRAHPAIYPINPRGLTGWGDVTIESTEAMDLAISMSRAAQSGDRTVAENTGGIAIVQTNMFDENIERAYIENRAYYILGYHSTNTATERKLRKISVSVARDDATVRSRSGYAAASPKAADAPEPTVPAELSRAALALVPATALRLEATVVPFRGASGPMLAVIAAAQPSIPPGGRRTKEEVQVRAVLVDQHGDIKETAERRVGGTVSAATGRRAELRVPMLLPGRSGRHQVRIAANSVASNATGSVFVNVDVPDFNREPLSLSGVALRVRPDSPDMTLPALDAVFPFVPSTRRTFRSTDTVEAAVRVYATPSEGAVSVACRIKNAAEAIVSVDERAARAPELKGAAGALIRCPVPIATLTAGHYLFEIEALEGERSVVRAFKFVVE